MGAPDAPRSSCAAGMCHRRPWSSPCSCSSSRPPRLVSMPHGPPPKPRARRRRRTRTREPTSSVEWKTPPSRSLAAGSPLPGGAPNKRSPTRAPAEHPSQGHKTRQTPSVAGTTARQRVRPRPSRTSVATDTGDRRPEPETVPDPDTGRHMPHWARSVASVTGVNQPAVLEDPVGARQRSRRSAGLMARRGRERPESCRAG